MMHIMVIVQVLCIKKYTKIKILDTNILNEFIDKIIISEPVYEENIRHQQIDIYYKFIGC